MRQLILLGLVTTFLWSIAPVARATPQLLDTLIYADREYAMHEFPMTGLWDYGGGGRDPGTIEPPDFDSAGSANWGGYRAVWEIRESRLRLVEITGKIDGQPVKNREIIKDRPFPGTARWFSGRIHLTVGEMDRMTGEYESVIVFHIEKGIVTKTTFRESMRLPYTWNGRSYAWHAGAVEAPRPSDG